MSSIKIVTDSTSDIPKEIAAKQGISVVPLSIHIDDEILLDGIDISSSEFFRRLPDAKKLPSTSQPTPKAFSEVYEELGKDAEIIISIHISEKMSGTLNSVRTAMNTIEGVDIIPIDSHSVSGGLAALVLEAAKGVKEEKDINSILESIESAQKTLKVIFTVDTLEYLEKNGRIGKATAFLGSLMKVKPILEVDIKEGQVVPLERCRGSRKSLVRLSNLVKTSFPGDNLNAIIMHGDSMERALEIKEHLEKLYKKTDIKVWSIGPVIGVHTGPGVIGVAAY